MADFDLSPEDLQSESGFADSIILNQKNREGGNPLRTTASQVGNNRVGLTTATLSEVLQGKAIYRPNGFLASQYNQSLSSDLSGLLQSEGGVNAILGGRQGALAYDITRQSAFSDGLFEQASGIPNVANPAVLGDGVGSRHPGSGAASGGGIDPGGGSSPYPDPDLGGRLPSGWVFPLQISKPDLLAKGWKPTGDMQHHSYNAADIFAPPGTPVVAAVSGIIRRTRKNNNNGLGGRTNVEGEDGFWYYYTHMFPESLQVEDGDHVTAGQHLGNVGESVNAQGTPPHLHFDVSPQENSFSRSWGYANGPLINPQPGLAAAFELLPG